MQELRCRNNARDQSQLGILGRLTACLEKGRRYLAPHSIISSADLSSSRAFHHLEDHRRELSGASLNAFVDHTLAESVAERDAASSVARYLILPRRRSRTRLIRDSPRRALRPPAARSKRRALHAPDLRFIRLGDRQGGARFVPQVAACRASEQAPKVGRAPPRKPVRQKLPEPAAVIAQNRRHARILLDQSGPRWFAAPRQGRNPMFHRRPIVAAASVLALCCAANSGSAAKMGERCDGFVGDRCGRGLWCDRDPGQCGLADRHGTCVKVRQLCF